VLEHLIKLAARAAQLRVAAIRKEAGIIGSVSKSIGGALTPTPGKVIGGMAFGLAAGQAVTQKSKEFKSGFDPNSQQQMQGRPPTPPGA